MSKTITGLIVALTANVLQLLGIPYVPEELEKYGTLILEVVGIALAWYGRWQLGGINVLGKRKY